MGFSNRLKVSVLAGILAGVVVIGCNRPIQVAPTLPSITMNLGNGPAVPGPSAQMPGAADVPVMQLNAANPSTAPVTLTNITLTGAASGTGNDATGITDVDLHLDVNNNGVVDAGDILLTTGTNTFSVDGGTVTLPVGQVIPGGTSVNLLVTYDFSPTAPAGSYQPSLAGNGSLTGTDSLGRPISFTGATGITGATITINAATSTPTQTNTLTTTHTPTRTNTLVNTATSTHTPTATNTATRTNTGVSTATSTATSSNTSTRTATQTATNTGANTATSTSTATPTSTNTTANTATPTFTPCYPASIQTTYTFDSAIDCWMPSTPSQPFIPYYGVDNDQVNQGTNSLHIAVNNTSGSPQPIQMNLGFAAPIDLTGMMMVAMVYVDASLTPSDYSGGVQPFYQSGPNWGSADWDDAWFTVNNTPPANVGAWFPVTIIFGSGDGDPSQVLQVGIQLTGVPPGAVGNFYIDNVQILPAPVAATSTSTPTATVTSTDTPMGAPLCTATPVNPSPYSEAEAPANGGPSTGTNENCATAEILGSVLLDNDVVVTGSLATSGNASGNYAPTVDQDYYQFTTGAAGIYTITLDCFSTGSDTNDFDLVIFDNACGYLGQSAQAGGIPEFLTSPPLPMGTVVNVLVLGWDGSPQSPYRLVIAGRAEPATPTQTSTNTPVPADTETSTATTTPTVAADTPTATPTPTSAACVPSFQPSYDFETDDECFTAWNGPGDLAFSLDTNTANTHNASNGSFMVTGTYSAGEVLIGLDFPSPATIPMGSIVTFWYKSSTGPGNAQLFHQSPGWQSGAWQNSPLSTTWTQVSFTMTGGTEGSTNQIGMQFLNLNGAVTIWIDDVTISDPPTPTPTPMAECNPLLNGAETLTDNGVWGGNSIRSLSGLNATQGSSSLDVNIVAATGYNDQFLHLNNFAPSNWTNVIQLQADVYADANVLGTGWNELLLIGDSQPTSKYYDQISSTVPTMAAGQQTVTWNLDFPIGDGIQEIAAGDPLTGLRIIYNSGPGITAANNGHVYVDNFRLVYSPCPPTPMFSWPFTSSLESWTDHTGDGTIDTGVVTSWIPTGYAGGAGAVNVSVPFTGPDQFEWVKIDTGGIDLTGTTTIEMYVWIDASIAGSGYPGGQIIVQSGAAWAGWQQGAWTNLTPGGWTKLTFTPPWGGSNDITMVQRIAIQVHTGGAGTGQATGNIKVDNVKVY